MCIRATDYLPPVDPTFSDFLRAMVTADFELNRADDSGLRASMIESFRLRGIRPESVGSLAVQSLLLESEDLTQQQPDKELAAIVGKLVDFGARQLGRNTAIQILTTERPRRSPRPDLADIDWVAQQSSSLLFGRRRRRPGGPPALSEADEPDEVLREIAGRLTNWAKLNVERLRLDPGKVALRGYHPVHALRPAASCWWRWLRTSCRPATWVARTSVGSNTGPASR
jgi:hypothetical protein